MNVKQIAVVALCALLCTGASAKSKGADNTLTPKEKKEGWKLLWDGKTKNGWKSIKGGPVPATGWTIENGTLSIADNDNKSSVGDIITDRKYKNFELSVDFLYTDGANSGIKYFITEDKSGKTVNVGCEYQILDDLLHPDAKLGHDGNRRLGALYDIMPATIKTPAKAGEWNTARIVVNGNRVTHYLNGKKILEYERGSQQWKEGVARSKFNKRSNFGMAEEGYILLQDHGKKVSFKNIKIKEL